MENYISVLHRSVTAVAISDATEMPAPHLESTLHFIYFRLLELMKYFFEFVC